MSDKFEITEGTAAQMRALGLSDEQIQSLRDGSFMNRPSERDQLLTQLAQERAKNAALEKERAEAVLDFEGRKASEEAAVAEANRLIEENETLKQWTVDKQAWATDAEIVRLMRERDDLRATLATWRPAR